MADEGLRRILGQLDLALTIDAKSETAGRDLPAMRTNLRTAKRKKFANKYQLRKEAKM